MDATELSEQIKQHLEAGEWPQAAAQLNVEWNAVSDFGLIHCDRPGYSNVWVRFKTSGYPFRLRREWDEAKTDSEALMLLAPYIVEWNVTNINSSALSLNGARDSALFDDIDETLVVWLIGAFVRFWRIDLVQPRKN